MSFSQKSPTAQLAQGRPVPANAKKKKSRVLAKEPSSEIAAGTFHQACRRRTSNTLISHNSHMQPKISNNRRESKTNAMYYLSRGKIRIEQWRKHYNTKRPHSALGCRPPAPESIVPVTRTMAFN